MSTTYTLRPGYSYGASATVAQILEAARSIPLIRLRNKIVEYGIADTKELDEYIARYDVLPTDDLTFRVAETSVYSCASGGGRERELKEIVRRAFCILVLDECYRRGWSVSLEVA